MSLFGAIPTISVMATSFIVKKYVKTQTTVKMNNKIYSIIFQIIKWGSITSIISVIMMSVYFMTGIRMTERYEFVVGILGIFIFFIPFITFLFITYLVVMNLVSRDDVSKTYKLKNILSLFIVNILFLVGYFYLGLSIEGKR